MPTHLAGDSTDKGLELRICMEETVRMEEVVGALTWLGTRSHVYTQVEETRVCSQSAAPLSLAP